jgi:molecular chaperone DnaK (HSP70)
MYLNLTVQQVQRLIDLLSKEVEYSNNPQDIQYFLDDDGWLLSHLRSRVTAEKFEQLCSNDLDDIPF